MRSICGIDSGVNNTMSSTRFRNSGRKWSSQFCHHPLASVGLDFAVGSDAVEQVVRSDVGRHDDHRVAEVDLMALRIGEPPVVENLQQGVEHICVGFLDLVEQHHRVGLAPHRFGELAALVVADVSRRRPNQSADRMPLLVLTHIKPHHVVLTVEQGSGQRPREFGLTNTGRSQENERPDRAARVSDSGTRTDDSVGDKLHCLVLADHPFVQYFVEPQELFAFALP